MHPFRFLLFYVILCLGVASDEFDEAPAQAVEDTVETKLPDSADNSKGEKKPFLEMMLTNIRRSGDMNGG